MTPTPGSGRSPRVSASIPTAWETALNDLRKQRFLTTDSDDPPNKSQVLREAVELYLAVLKAHGSLPTDALDDVEGIDSSEVLDEYSLEIGSGYPEKGVAEKFKEAGEA